MRIRTTGLVNFKIGKENYSCQQTELCLSIHLRNNYRFQSEEGGCARRRVDALGGGWARQEEGGCARRRVGALGGGWMRYEEGGRARRRVGALGGG